MISADTQATKKIKPSVTLLQMTQRKLHIQQRQRVILLNLVWLRSNVKLGFEEPTLLKDKYPVNVQVSEFTIEDTKPSRIEEHEINLQVAVSGLNIKTFLV